MSNLSDPEGARSMKDMGNEKFAAGKFDEAFQLYTMAISLDATQVVYYSNAAQCLVNLKEYQKAVQFATLALNLDPQHVKSLVRRAAALQALAQPEAALKDISLAAKLEPSNKNIISELSSLMKAVQVSPEAKMTASAPSSAATSSPKLSSQGKLEKRTALDEARVDLSSRTPELPQAPSTFGEFEVHWKTLVPFPELMTQYLTSISPSQYSPMFKDLLSADMFVSFLQTTLNILSRGDSASAAQAAEILSSLSLLPRFSLLKMFLSSDQKKLIATIFENASLQAQPNILDLKTRFM